MIEAPLEGNLRRVQTSKRNLQNNALRRQSQILPGEGRKVLRNENPKMIGAQKASSATGSWLLCLISWWHPAPQKVRRPDHDTPFEEHLGTHEEKISCETTSNLVEPLQVGGFNRYRAESLIHGS